MSASNVTGAKLKAQREANRAKVSAAQSLTEAWRERVKQIRLNRPGQKRLTLHQLIAEGRR